ncbi:hypothetical protein R9X47_01725 [Wukongibacter baidiensis]|uniref:hypothetical protein n=1 Tax=Wukongibacter baidiensis TaxID=1723361 RepID=UPI003D7F9552
MAVISKKCLKGLAVLGAGISMLIGIGVSEGIGVATGLAIDAIARNPELTENIIEGLLLGIFITLIPFWAALLVALCLLLITKRLICTDLTMIRELAALGAGIAVLGGIGAGLGIGTSVGAALEAFARNPDALDEIIQAFLIGSFFIFIPAVVAFIIAIYLLGIAKKKCCIVNKCYSKTKRYDNF